MYKLHEIIKNKNSAIQKRIDIQEKYKKEMQGMSVVVDDWQRLEDLASANNDIEQIQIAEKVLQIEGNIYGVTDWIKEHGGLVVAEKAILDIANNCEHLKKERFGNKEYSAYYQECNCSYGMGPRHGSIVDSIGLKGEYRDKDLTDKEKDACIYYLKNYRNIKKSNL